MVCPLGMCYKETLGEQAIFLGSYLNCVLHTATVSNFKSKSVQINPFAPGDFAEKRVWKLVEWFSGHCRAIKG